MAATPRRALIAVPALVLISGHGVAQRSDRPPDSWRDPAANIVAWFETSGAGARSYGYVAGDFDGQGVSAGCWQWNIGKGSLWSEILKDVPERELREAMPVFGARLRDALRRGPMHGMVFAKELQTYIDENAHTAGARGATWKPEGRRFAAELSALLDSPAGRALQDRAIDSKLDMAWTLATAWARALRSPSATPSFREFAAFCDAYNFSGTWWTELAGAPRVEARRHRLGDREAFAGVIAFLRSDIPGQLQARAARQNAEIWERLSPNEEQLQLMLMAQLTAEAIGKPNAVQFKKNLVSRRGAVVFNDGYVNGTRKRFEMPS